MLQETAWEKVSTELQTLSGYQEIIIVKKH